MIKIIISTTIKRLNFLERSPKQMILVEKTDFKNGNLTFVSATLGRTATFKCVAKNLVGQKTVSIYNNIQQQQQWQLI